MASAHRPTLKTIAELSGFAVQTVSRALGDAPDISAKTKEKVRKIANEIGYVPNRAGVRLRTGKTNVISLVLSTDKNVLSLTARLIGSIAEGLRGTPYHLVVTPEFPDDDPMKAIRYIVQNSTADAIILNRIQPEDPRVRFLMDEGFPFATHGRTIWADQHPYFDYDNYEFGRLSVDALADRGRKRLLLLAPPADQNYAREIVVGTSAQAKRRHVTLIPAASLDSDSPGNLIRAYVADTLRNDGTIDGIISPSPNAAMAAVAGCEDAGRHLGNDIDVFSKDTIPILDLFRTGIMTISEDIEKAGHFLAKAAVSAAKKGDSPPMQELDTPCHETKGA